MSKGVRKGRALAAAAAALVVIGIVGGAATVAVAADPPGASVRAQVVKPAGCGHFDCEQELALPSAVWQALSGRPHFCWHAVSPHAHALMHVRYVPQAPL